MVNIYYNNVEINNWIDWRKIALYLPQKTAISDIIVNDFFQIPFKFISRKNNHIDNDLLNNYLNKLDLSNDILEKNLNILSGGEISRIAFIRALLLKPEILLLDEFSAALDENTTFKIENLLLEFSKNNSEIIVMFISHKKEQINRLSQRQLYIDNGIINEL